MASKPQDLPLGEVVIAGENTAFRLTCDALACDQYDRILLLSAAGAETSVKALAASLRSECRISIRPDMPGLYLPSAHQDPAGYKVYRTRLDLNTWHVLCVTKAEGFLPVLNDDSLWRELRSDRFTTPLLRSWMPWLRRQLESRRLLADLRQRGCSSGLLLLSTDGLDKIVSDGIKTRALRIHANA